MRRTVLVTGGSRGIGRAIVEILAQEGWSVLFFYRNSANQANEIVQKAAEAGQDVHAFRCDVADGTQIRETVAAILRQWHHIDALVNNAGVAHIGLFTDMTEAQWDRVFNIDVKGVYHVTHAVLPAMISEGKGSIVNIASMWGEAGASCEVAYSAAKAAVIGMTKALAKEAGPSGIRVNCVSPGVIDTEMNGELSGETMQELADKTPLGCIGTPAQAASAVKFLLSDEASFITGQVLGVSGGFQI